MPKTDTATIEQSTTTVDSAEIAGTSFAAKLAEAQAKAAPVADEPTEQAASDRKELLKEDAKIHGWDKPFQPAKPEKKATPMDLPAKKVDAPPSDDDEFDKLLKTELPANATASQKASLGALRKAADRERSRAKELEAKLSERDKAGTASPELEAKLKEAQDAVRERDELIERVAFERSAKFQQFVKAEADELAAAKSYLEGSDIDPSIIETASRLTGAKRLQVLADSGMESHVIAAVTNNLSRLDAVNRQKATAQENWKGTQAQWEAEQRAQQEKQSSLQKENEDRVFATVGKSITSSIEPFQKVENNEDWNSAVDQRLAQAKDIFDGKLPLEKTSEIIYKGAAFDVMHEAWRDLRGKYNDAVSELERIKASSPGAASTSPDKGGGKAATGDPLRDAADTFNEQLSRRRA